MHNIVHNQMHIYCISEFLLSKKRMKLGTKIVVRVEEDEARVQPNDHYGAVGVEKENEEGERPGELVSRRL